MESKVGVFIKKLIKRYVAHNVAANSAQVAYYWILAFFPFLIFVISLLTFANISVDVLLEYIAAIVPTSLMPFIETTINQFILYRSTTLLSMGVLISLWSGGTAVNALLRGIHLAYNSKFVKPFWLSKIVAIIYTILLAMLLILMMVALVFGNRIGAYVVHVLKLNKGIIMPIWNVIRLIMPFFALITILYIIYRIVPRKHLKVKNVWLGTIAASVGWYGFSLIFAIYVDNYSKYNQLYGSIGGVFILLIWLYASCMVLLLGAEINAVYQEMKIEKIIRQMS
nr:YihY/virulence factor BrkB family protein [uncultured Cellulosilyticum sp.]